MQIKQTIGESTSWQLPWHSLVLEGGFEDYERSYFIQIGASNALQELWRKHASRFFLERGFLDEFLAVSMLGWQHSGFSEEESNWVYDDAALKSLSQYIVRVPIGLL